MNKDNIPVHIAFNAVVFIESLDDDRTTKDVFTNIKYSLFDERIGLVYISIEDKAELINLLTEILSNKTLYPILHFATHGSIGGIKLRKEFVEWKHIMPILQQINFRVRNTLTIIMASCYGLYALAGVQENERAPFGLLIGPQNEILEDKLDELLKVFYVNLFKSK